MAFDLVSWAVAGLSLSKSSFISATFKTGSVYGSECVFSGVVLILLFDFRGSSGGFWIVSTFLTEFSLLVTFFTLKL